MSTADLELPEGAEPEETLFEASYNAGDESERRFDEIISALEDAVMAPAFRDPIVAFCREHCKAFVPGVDENTLEQHALFSRYEELTEARVERELTARIPGFDMSAFEAMLAQPGRAEAISGDVLDLLMAFGDYDEFKSTMLSYREQIEYEEAQAPPPGSSRSAGGGASGQATSAGSSARWDTGVPGLVASPLIVPPGAPPAAERQRSSFAASEGGSGGMAGLEIVGRGASLGGALPAYAGMGPTVTSLGRGGGGGGAGSARR